MKRFLAIAFVGTAALLLHMFTQTRQRLQEEARRFDEICPEPPEAPETEKD